MQFHFDSFHDTVLYKEFITYARENALALALIDTRQYLKNLNRDDEDCFYLAGEFEWILKLSKNPQNCLLF
jgi:type IV secretory pathway VirJ component